MYMTIMALSEKVLGSEKVLTQKAKIDFTLLSSNQKQKMPGAGQPFTTGNSFNKLGTY